MYGQYHPGVRFSLVLHKRILKGFVCAKNWSLRGEGYSPGMNTVTDTLDTGSVSGLCVWSPSESTVGVCVCARARSSHPAS